MWQSTKEYILAVLKWWWVVAIGVLLPIVALVLDAVGGLTIPIWVRVTIGLLGLFIAQFLAFHKVRVERDRLQRQPAPTIEVTPKKDEHDIYYLDVHNVGEYAEFEAQVEVLEGKDFTPELPSMYSAYWHKTKRDKTEIMKGQRDGLKIATLEMDTRVLSACFRFHYYVTSYSMGEPFQTILGVNSNSWIPGSNQAVKPCFKLKVTISSNPSMKDGAFSRVYELSPEGFSEIST